MDRTTQFVGSSIFIGSGYVLEQHSDETHYLPEEHSFAEDFGQMLKTLRAALSLR